MRPFLALLFLFGCGKTPLDENYWDENLREIQREEADSGGNLSASLSPTSSVGFENADALLTVSGNAVFLDVKVTGVPQNLVQSQIFVVSTPCAELTASPAGTFASISRNYTYNDNTTLTALFKDPAESDGLTGKFLVIEGFASGSPATSFPFACGPILNSRNANTVRGEF